MPPNCPVCGRFCANVTGHASSHEGGPYLKLVIGECRKHGEVRLAGYSFEDFFDEDEAARAAGGKDA